LKSRRRKATATAASEEEEEGVNYAISEEQSKLI